MKLSLVFIISILISSKLLSQTPDSVEPFIIRSVEKVKLEKHYVITHHPFNDRKFLGSVLWGIGSIVMINCAIQAREDANKDIISFIILGPTPEMLKGLGIVAGCVSFVKFLKCIPRNTKEETYSFSSEFHLKQKKEPYLDIIIHVTGINLVYNF